MSLIRRARKLLRHHACGQRTGHDPHTWTIRASDDPAWGETCYCPGVSMTRRERQVARLLADIEDWSA